MGSLLAARRPGSTTMVFAAQQEASKINDFIYMSQGTSNSYFVLTSEGNILINTGLGVEAPVHKHCFDKVSEAPLRYIILTQGHVDHVGGVDLFKQAGTKVIAQKNLPECMTDDARILGYRMRKSVRFFPEFIQQMTQGEAESKQQKRSSPQAIPRADLLFDNHLKLSLGDLRLELISVPGGETIDSTLVWLPDHGILFSGNTLGPLFPHVPNLYTIRGDKLRFAAPYLAACDRILELDPALLITGHFEPIEGRALIRDEMARLRNAVSYIHDRTLEGMNEGKDMWHMMRSITLPESLQVGEEYGTVPWAVRAIWEGYVGWFQHRSTTEIYPSPPHEVYPEVVAAAGVASLLERAAALCDEEQSLAAIHLCEMILSSEPNHKPTLQVYLTAHQQLLATCHQRNRWQRYWIEGEIKATEQKLSS